MADSEKQSFTQGPWKLDDGGRIVPARNHPMPFGIKIISPWQEDAWDDDPEALANMKLMAAAPELLKALQSMLTIYKKYASDDPMEDEIVDYSNEVIKKATI